ncbi:hypothetical protein RRG08_050571 [Elysia crispata]|uniref:Uncharacterized protein n=1 Tax=Elysia crispata TaxID=231223 RepID=A0AAE0Z709_9GAST|nr:hypothetical protein RRG08_050571 [Elysia crispata]
MLGSGWFLVLREPLDYLSFVYRCALPCFSRLSCKRRVDLPPGIQPLFPPKISPKGYVVLLDPAALGEITCVGQGCSGLRSSVRQCRGLTDISWSVGLAGTLVHSAPGSSEAHNTSRFSWTLNSFMTPVESEQTLGLRFEGNTTFIDLENKTSTLGGQIEATCSIQTWPFSSQDLIQAVDHNLIGHLVWVDEIDGNLGWTANLEVDTIVTINGR